jgi:DNA primase
MDTFFLELQQLTLSDSKISDTRKVLNDLVNFMCNLDWQMQQQEAFANLRAFSVDTVRNAKGFMVLDNLPVGEIPEEFHGSALGFVNVNYITYLGRFVLPVMDVKGDVAGLVGYDMFENPKYLDSVTYGYKAKRTMLYGMENMRQYYDDGYVLVPEGSMCKLWLNQHKFNSLAILGSYLSPYCIDVLSRFGDKCIIIPDDDPAGNAFKNKLKYLLPKAQVWQTTTAKDIDDTTKIEVEENGERYFIRDEKRVEQLVYELGEKLHNPFVRTELIV